MGKIYCTLNRMSIDAYYMRMSQPELDEILSDDERMEELPSRPGDDPERLLCLHRYWETLHFILTGLDLPRSPERANNNVFSKALFGGECVGPDLGYGQARCLTAEEVQEIGIAVDDIDFDQLADGCTKEDFEDADIYAEDYDEEMLELKEVYFPEFKYFFQEAAKNGEVVLAYMA